jgi:hypothetical protein
MRETIAKIAGVKSNTLTVSERVGEDAEDGVFYMVAS